VGRRRDEALPVGGGRPGDFAAVRLIDEANSKYINAKRWCVGVGVNSG
jgi:hypothetical protein